MRQMNTDCRRSFGEELLSGHLDGFLTHGDRQRVEIHLEECESCRRLYAELRQLRDVARSTPFLPVEDDLWDETPRGWLSLWARGLGLALLLLTLLLALGLALWQPSEEPPLLLGRLLALGSIGGIGLLLTSALVDRLRVVGHDRYREVKK